MPRLLLLLLCVLLLGERAQEAAALTDVAAREPDRTVPPVGGLPPSVALLDAGQALILLRRPPRRNPASQRGRAQRRRCGYFRFAPAGHH